MFLIDSMESRSDILSLAVSPTGLVYAASFYGLRACTAAGTAWSAILPPPGESPFPVTAVAVSPRNTVFAGIQGGIAVSRDRGQTWFASAFPGPAPVFTAIAISPDERVILAGTAEDGVFRSTDGGDSWEPWNFGLLDQCVTSIAFSDDGPIFLGSSTGLFVSANGGKSWKPAKLESDYDAIPNIITHNGSVWIETESRRWLRSTDSGKNWERTRPLVERALSVISNVVFINGVPGVYAGLLTGEIAFLPLRL